MDADVGKLLDVGDVVDKSLEFKGDIPVVAANTLSTSRWKMMIYISNVLRDIY